jgi:Cyclic nucleotide-binding domain
VSMSARSDELRSIDLFAGLTDQQLAQLVAGGSEIDVRPGLELFREGEHADFWWVLLDGMIELGRHDGGEETVVARMDAPGQWAGGFRAWDDQGVYLATGRAVTAGRALRVPAEVMRDLIAAWFPLGGHLIQGLYRTARSIEATARQERLPAGNAEISLMPPPGGGERPDRRAHGGIVRHHDVKVDDRLGVQAGNGGAANVLGCVRDAGQRGVNAVAQLPEQARPSRVVRHDHRGNVHVTILPRPSSPEILARWPPHGI